MASDRITEVSEENTRLRAALAQSELPCVYCSLPADEWNKCESGSPGCGRMDDAMGCPELGASLEVKALRNRITQQDAVIAEITQLLEAGYGEFGKPEGEWSIGIIGYTITAALAKAKKEQTDVE